MDFKKMAGSKPMVLLVLGAAVAMVVAACGGGAEPTATSVSPTATPRATTAPPTATSPAMSATPTPRTAAPTATLAPTPAGDAPLYGGTLRAHARGLMNRFDPYMATSPSNIRDFSRITFNTLVTSDSLTKTLLPELVESWTLDSENNYTFKVRPGIRFHDVAPVNGRELTADDIKWSLDRARTHVQSIVKVRIGAVQDIQVIDPLTVKFIMARPDANLLFQLSFEQMVILPQEAAIDGFFDDPRTYIGTGPFIPQLLQLQGQNRYVRNANYFRKDAEGRDLPYLDGLEYLSPGSAGREVGPQAVALLKTGGIDWAPISLAADVQFFLGQDNVFVRPSRVIVGTSGLYFNVTIPPFNDKRLRQAVNLLIDRQEIIDIIDGGPEFAYITGIIGTEEALGHWSEAKVANLPGLRPDKSQDIVDAKALLAAAGVPNGFSFNLSSRGAELSDTYKLVQQQLLRYGIDLVLEATTNAGYERTDFSADKQSTNVTEGSGVTPDHALTNTFISTAPKNSANFVDPRLEALFAVEAATFDFTKRVVLLDEIQQFLFDEMPYAPLTRATDTWVSADYVMNWRPTASCCNLWTAQLDTMWIDRG